MSRWIPLSLGVLSGALVAAGLATAHARSVLAPEPPMRLEASTPATETVTGDVDCVVLSPPTEASLEAWLSHQLLEGRDRFVTGDGALYEARGVPVSPSEWVCAYRSSTDSSRRARSPGRSTRSR
jgi:hypothetical protein